MSAYEYHPQGVSEGWTAYQLVDAIKAYWSAHGCAYSGFGQQAAMVWCCAGEVHHFQAAGFLGGQLCGIRVALRHYLRGACAGA